MPHITVTFFFMFFLPILQFLFSLLYVLFCPSHHTFSLLTVFFLSFMSFHHFLATFPSFLTISLLLRHPLTSRSSCLQVFNFLYPSHHQRFFFSYASCFLVFFFSIHHIILATFSLFFASFLPIIYLFHGMHLTYSSVFVFFNDFRLFVAVNYNHQHTNEWKDSPFIAKTIKPFWQGKPVMTFIKCNKSHIVWSYSIHNYGWKPNDNNTWRQWE